MIIAGFTTIFLSSLRSLKLKAEALATMLSFHALANNLKTKRR